MQVIRISPEDGILREIADQRKRINSLGTRPTGNVVVRETLKTVDPVTGVETIIGELPDGSYGFQPFVGDVEPPPVPSPAQLQASPGFISVRWDGLFALGEEQPRDFQHLNVVLYEVLEGVYIRKGVIGIIRTPKDTLIIGTDVARAGSTWAVTFTSEDYNGNESVESATSASVTMEAILSTVDEAWTDMLDSVREASEKAQTAQTVAADAQAAADAAIEDALRAIGAVDGKGKVIFSDTAPGEADRNAQTLWIDTTGGANTPKRWTTGTTWVEVTDKKIVDAAAAASRAEQTANQAYNASVTASTAAGNALTAANGKNRNWYQTTEPAGVDHRDGDIWFDTANGNQMKIWKASTTKWENIDNARIASAEATANAAQQSANGKNKIWYSATKPTGTTHSTNDIWFDSANGNRPMRWNPTINDWESIRDQTAVDAVSKATIALESANGKSTNYYGPTEPTGSTLRANDLWFDTSNGNRPMRWDGTGWISAQDAAIASAKSTADSALTAANGKNKLVFSSSDASGTNYTAGDMWFRRDAAGVVIGQWEFTTSWQKRTIGDAVIANLSAAKISTGFLSSDRIQAKSISVEKLLISSTDNIVSDADFSDSTGAAWTAGYGGQMSWDATGGRNSAPSLKVTVNSSQQGTYNKFDTPASGGSAYRVTAWVKSTVDVPVGSITIYGRQKYVGGGSNYTGTSKTDAVSNETIIPANTWTPISGIIKLKDNALTVAFGIFVQTTLTTGTVWVDYLSATRAADASLVVDGSISSASIVAGGIDAGVIKFGSMHGNRISANSIDSSKLLIGAIDNLVPNPKMVEGIGWTGAGAGSGSGFSKEIVYPAMDQSYKMTQRNAGLSNMSLYAPVPALIPVNPGETFYASTAVYTTGTSPFSSVEQRVYFYDASGAMLSGAPGNSLAGSVVRSLTDNTWTEIGGLTIKTPAGAAFMAPRITVYYPVGYTPTSAVFYVGNPKVYRATGSTLIENGAITTDHMTAGTIDGKVISASSIKGTQIDAQTITAGNIASGQINAGHIVSGSIDASHIKGKSITADKLVISSTDNLIMEADFSNAGSSWQRPTGVTIAATGGRSSLPSMRFTGSTAALVSTNLANKIPVGQDDRFRGSIFYKTNSNLSAGSVSLRLKAYTSATASTEVVIAQNSDETTSGTWKQISGISPALPANTIAVEFILRVQNPTTGTVTDVDFVSATKAFTGSLIVDGAIDGKTITGATIRTAATGSRVIIDANGLQAFNSSDVRYLNVANGTLSMIGNISASDISTSGTEVVATMGDISSFGGAAISPGFGFSPKSGSGSTFEVAGLWSKTGTGVTINSQGTGAGSGGTLSPRMAFGDDAFTGSGTIMMQATDGVHIRYNSSAYGKLSVRSINEVFSMNNRLPIPMLAQYYVQQTGVPYSNVWGPGMPALVGEANPYPLGRTAENSIGSWTANDIYTFAEDGLYTINWHIGFITTPNPGPGGWMEIGLGANTGRDLNFASRLIGATNTASLAMAPISFLAGDRVCFHFAHIVASGNQTIQHKIRITRIS